MTDGVNSGESGRAPSWHGASREPARPESANLADILERVLDKGIVIAGDIELLTIKLRLVVASVERAREMGIDWWEHDPTLSSSADESDLAEENRSLRQRLRELEGEHDGAPEMPGEDERNTERTREPADSDGEQRGG